MASPAQAPDAPRPMCLACGQYLKPNDLKCPSCGALLQGQRPARRSRALTMAGAVLLGLSILWLLVGGAALLSTRAATPPETRFAFGDFGLAGTVEREDGAPAAGTRVVADGDDGPSTNSSGDGSFRLAPLAAGYHRIRFEAENGSTAELLLYLFRNESATVRLPAGNETIVQEHPSLQILRKSIAALGALVAVVALVTLLGAVACWRRRRYALALGAAIASTVFALLLIFVFPPAILASLLALVLVVRGKRDFR